MQWRNKAELLIIKDENPKLNLLAEKSDFALVDRMSVQMPFYF